MSRIVSVIKKQLKKYKWVTKTHMIFRKLYMVFYNKVVGVKANKVVFMGYNGKLYAGNPKAISEALHKADPSVEIVWMFDEPEVKSKIVPDYIRIVKRNTFEALREEATASVWVDNFCKHLMIYKGRNQTYIQTWHGDRGFKKVLYDSTFIGDDYQLIEEKICDLTVSGSDFSSSVYRTAFRYEGEILEVGSPRDDLLVNNPPGVADTIKQELSISKEKKILIFAPTLRRGAMRSQEDQEIGSLDLAEVLDVLSSSTGDDWICLVRAHSAVSGLSGIPEDDERFLNVSSYEDMRDLLFISDMIITDYSSCGADFALLGRPVIFFQSDRQDYLEKDRTFYFDIDKTPFMIALSQQELIEMIQNLDYNSVEQNCKDLLEFYGTFESGKSSDRVATYIIDRINEVNHG